MEILNASPFTYHNTHYSLFHNHQSSSSVGSSVQFSSAMNVPASANAQPTTPRHHGLKRKFCDGEFFPMDQEDDSMARPAKQVRTSLTTTSVFGGANTPDFVSSPFATAASSSLSSIETVGQQQTTTSRKRRFSEMEETLPDKRARISELAPAEAQSSTQMIGPLVPVASMELNIPPELLASSSFPSPSSWPTMYPQSGESTLVPYRPTVPSLGRPIYLPITSESEATKSQRNRIVEITEEEAEELIQSSQATSSSKTGILMEDDESSSSMEMD